MRRRNAFCLALTTFLLVSTLLLVLKWICSSVLINVLYNDLGNRNWSVELDYGYSIEELNGDEIILVKDGWEVSNDIVIPVKICFYFVDAQYAFFICSDDNSKIVQTIYTNQQVFYILNMEKDILIGPLDEKEFRKYCEEKDIVRNIEWIPTCPRPNNSTYD